ncbi:hypothetical protein MTR67_052604 [Solanum verrucosum]|uniref:Reverse transcriptase/retrotransposon-derived protein RNase H-like domain-containing protein n=1 Tax=Solanum verrucosum TaxID=315347 RepID=A0AAF0V8Q1_SOLVR|nr:hypothetical protein MTR67_052604 [Solanum verrucosum]
MASFVIHTAGVLFENKIAPSHNFGVGWRKWAGRKFKWDVGKQTKSKGIEVDLKKTNAIKSWPRPLSPSDIRRFLGLVSNYRRFVEGFSSIVSPLTTFTQMKVKFVWSEACKKSFQELKDRLTSAPVLCLPEGSNGFVVYCDALRVGLGCDLMNNGKIIAYASRQLKLMKRTILPTIWN